MRFLFTIFLFFLNLSLYCQITLSGYIQEEGSGERLPYSNVYIPDIEKGSSANENGFFTVIGDIKPGMVLRASYVGFQTKSITINQDMIDGNLEISLTALTSTLNEVVVSTESNKFLQASSEISKHKMSVQQLSLMPSIGEVDIFRSLQLLPGVSATNENSSGLYIRGGEPQENLVLLDGIKVYNVDHFTIKSKDMSLPKDKRLDFNIWYDKNKSLILRISYSRLGNWEYRLKDFE